MQLVEKHQIKTSHSLYSLCDTLCFLGKNLYNAALYEYRQSFIAKDKKTLGWTDINKIFNTDNQHDYRQLPAKVSNAVLKRLGDNITSFWGLMKARKTGNITQSVRLPKYLHKTKGRFVVEFNSQTISKKRTKEGYLVLCPKDLNLVIPTLREDVKQIRIVPKHSYFVLEVVYDIQEQAQKPDKAFAAIDLGLNNLATVVANDGSQPLIVSGGRIKAINRYFNKTIAQANSLLPKEIYTSKALDRLWLKRNNKLDHEIHKISKWLADYFDERAISTVIIGNNNSWKTGITLGKRVNQNFAYVPYTKLIAQLIYKCKLKGIMVIAREESYTSKASFLDYDSVPTLNDNQPKVFSGKRIKRGLYVSKNGKKINADVNGAYNIMAKEKPDLVASNRISLSYSPKRIKL